MGTTHHCTPQLLTNALIEGLGSISTRIFHEDKELLAAVKRFSFNATDFYSFLENYPSQNDKIFLAEWFEKKKCDLGDLLKKADTGTVEYKRFSYLIQLLWNTLNPKLNPLFYTDGTLEKGASAFLLTTGLTKLPSPTEEWDYSVGINLATSKGYVIFENEVMQLLYYPANIQNAKEKPILIVPPWINKYYIFDLSKKNSYISWLTKKNISVYCVSWVNPDPSFCDQRLRDYVLNGIHRAVTRIQEHAKVSSVNIVGYCVGGVTVQLYAGWAAKQKLNVIESLTFLSTPFDFEKLDCLRLFISEEQVDTLEGQITADGVFNGDRLMQTFSLLRANDVLIQSVIDYIYLNKKQKPLDFLFWNADTMHLPGQVHLDFLKEIFLENAFLKKPATILGLDVDFNTVTCPVYVLGTQKDHIVPWHSCLSSFNVYKHVTFCLGGSGHVAGIINPPEQKKYGYRTNPMKENSPEEWLANSTAHDGSWWTHWYAWLKPNLGKKKQIRSLAENDVIENAPGRYALQKASSI